MAKREKTDRGLIGSTRIEHGMSIAAGPASGVQEHIMNSVMRVNAWYNDVLEANEWLHKRRLSKTSSRAHQRDGRGTELLCSRASALHCISGHIHRDYEGAYK